MTKSTSPGLRPISRRNFLAGVAATAAGLLAGCRPTAQPTPTSPGEPVVGPISTDTPLPPTYTPTASPTLAPTSTSTQTPVKIPTATPTNLPTVTSTPIPTPMTAPTHTPTTVPAPSKPYQVAIAQATNYDRSLIRQQVQTMFEGLGGLADVVKPGDRVAIKVNLTGGSSQTPGGVSPTESYFTHPEVVRALGELLRDAGAGQIYIVEAIWDQSYTSLGYAEVVSMLNASLIDLNAVQPYSDFSTMPVGQNWFTYQNFIFNHILEEIDVFVSVAKMKCHFNCGVTHAMKNLVGLVPMQHYQQNQADGFRSALHGAADETGTRLPRVILDLNRARPIHLALIDGVKTSEGGEGPWQQSFAPIAPGVLIAGKNAVSTDAVATAAMGFEPMAVSYSIPFSRCDNYLNLAYELGLGSNRLEDIKVVGASLDEVRYEFRPA